MKGCSGIWEKFDSRCSFLQVFFGNTRKLKYFRPQNSASLSYKPETLHYSCIKNKSDSLQGGKNSRNKWSIRFTHGSFIDNIWKYEINMWQLQNETQYKIYKWRKKHKSILVAGTHIWNIFRSLELKSKKQ